jgi:hypothetical protein
LLLLILCRRHKPVPGGQRAKQPQHVVGDHHIMWG